MFKVKLASQLGGEAELYEVESFQDLRTNHSSMFAVDLKNPKKVKNLKQSQFNSIKQLSREEKEDTPKNPPKKNDSAGAETKAKEGSGDKGKDKEPAPPREELDSTSNAPTSKETDTEAATTAPQPQIQAPKVRTAMSPMLSDLAASFQSAIKSQSEALAALVGEVRNALSEHSDNSKASADRMLERIADLLSGPQATEHAKQLVEKQLAGIDELREKHEAELSSLAGKVTKELRKLEDLEEAIDDDSSELRRQIKRYRPAEIELLKQRAESLESELLDIKQDRERLQLQLSRKAADAIDYDPARLAELQKENTELRKKQRSTDDLQQQLDVANQEIERLQPFQEEAYRNKADQQELARLAKFENSYESEKETLEADLRQAQSSLTSERRRRIEAEDRYARLKVDADNVEELTAERDSLRSNNATLESRVQSLNASTEELRNERNRLELQLSEGEEVYRAKVHEENAKLLKQRRDEIRKELEMQFNELFKALEQSKDESESAMGRTRELEALLSQETATADKLREDNAAMRAQLVPGLISSEIEALRRKKNDLTKEADAIGEDLMRQKGELHELQSEKAELAGTIAALQQEREKETALKERREEQLKRKQESLFEPWDGGDPAEESQADNEWKWLEDIHDKIEDSGFRVSKRLLRAFHTSLKSQTISPLTLLMGISGTGKSELPRLYADFGGIYFLPVAVQPNWDSPMDLFGFFNYADGYFRSTPLSQAMYQFTHGDSKGSRMDRMLLVLLDEMNLARVEHYFSDLLSKLESRRSVADPDAASPEQLARCSIELDRGDQPSVSLLLRQNVLFTGTLNQDESTMELSDKVIDRSNVITFPRPDSFVFEPDHSSQEVAPSKLSYEKWQEWRNNTNDMDQKLKQELESEFQKLNEALALVGRGVGQRVFQAVYSYISAYPAAQKKDARKAIEAAREDQYAMKILPKLRGIDLTSPRGQKCVRDVAKLLPDKLRDSVEEVAKDRDVFAWEGAGELFAEE